jgi:NAD(P)-dependent dehydrogenase (short-subunit alcohol dehydrogenase family)
MKSLNVFLAKYAKNNIRFNAVAPGQVDTPLHKNNPKEFLKTLSPMGTVSDAKDIFSRDRGAMKLTEAPPSTQSMRMSESTWLLLCATSEVRQ